MSNPTNNVNQSFHRALKIATDKGISDGDRVLLLLTETVRPHFEDVSPFYTYTDPKARLVFDMGENEHGQRQFLVSIDPRFSHHPEHPQPEVMAGWNWTLYGEVKPEPERIEKAQPIVIVLTELERFEPDDGKGERKAIIPQKVNPLDPLPGFSLASLGVFEGHKQFVIVIQSDKFRVQLSQN
jgi:hypothetical protein